MALVPVRRTTQTAQGEINSEENRAFTTEHATVTKTPGIETTQEIRPEINSRSIEEAATQTTTTTETAAPKVTTQLEAPRTTTSTNAAHQVRTLQLPTSQVSLSNEDAVMDIEFTLKIRDLRCL